MNFKLCKKLSLIVTLILTLTSITGLTFANNTDFVLTQLTNNSGPDLNPNWSPDGEKIVYNNEFDIYKINTETFENEVLLDDEYYIESHPIWCPDNSKMLYEISSASFDPTMSMKNLSDNSDFEITFEPEDSSITYSPDGTKIVYFYTSISSPTVPNMIVSNSDGTDPITIVRRQFLRPYHAAWSPDGSKIVFSAGPAVKRTINVINADGTELTEIALGDIRPQTQSWQSQIWSPDGEKIVYQFNDGNNNIYTINTDGTEQQQLTSNESEDFAPCFSPDGNKIVFVSSRNGNEDIWLMDTDGSNLIQLTTNPERDDSPSWNPQGDKIVFVSEREGNPDIWMIEFEENEIDTLTTHSESNHESDIEDKKVENGEEYDIINESETAEIQENDDNITPKSPMSPIISFGAIIAVYLTGRRKD
ncbi:hypothetical protein RE474_07545 [Methanolobus sediminis]|uniref:DUF5050 domain-containing protein n=1 Tax=Methanolobus sediminis TaxID=3072978 RepID=A0AA51UIL9_9EURY|nr:hypothetical protein [Methanolobus sediminis]WMW23957.1 hypothetical protein RE474_07545 [Methanolobus sediminis]